MEIIPDIRDRFGSDAPLITRNDVECAIAAEERQKRVDGYFCTYDLIKEFGVDQVLSWVRASVILQVGAASHVLREGD